VLSSPRSDARLAVLAGLTRLATNEDWITQVLRGMAELFQADTTYVTLFSPQDRCKAQLVALWDRGAVGEPSSYAITGTPCEEVLLNGELFVEQGLAQRYADDSWIRERKGVSLMSRRIDSSDGVPLGAVGVLHREPLRVEDPDQRALLDVFCGLLQGRLEAAAARDRIAARRAAAKAGPGSTELRLTVLVCDAESSVRAALARSLEHDGHEAVLVDSLEQLLRLARQLDAGLALVDARFPGVDTEQLIACLREQAPGMRLLLLDDHAQDSARAPCHGADGRLGKPFTPHDLRASVRAVCATPSPSAS